MSGDTATVTARRIIDRLCPSERTERHDGYTSHAGHVLLHDGYEFVAAVGGWHPHNPIRLLPDGGNWPYSFALATDDERAMIEYVEGDITVRVYDDEDGYRQALAEYARAGQ